MKIAVGQGSCGIAAGAMKAYDTLNSTLDLNKNQLTVTGCIGMCYLEPIVDVYADDGLHRYVKVTGEIAGKIATAINNNDLLSIKEFEISDDDKQFLDKQTRIALRHCGIINPEIAPGMIACFGLVALGLPFYRKQEECSCACEEEHEEEKCECGCCHNEE